MLSQNITQHLMYLFMAQMWRGEATLRLIRENMIVNTASVLKTSTKHGSSLRFSIRLSPIITLFVPQVAS